MGWACVRCRDRDTKTQGQVVEYRLYIYRHRRAIFAVDIGFPRNVYISLFRLRSVSDIIDRIFL